MPAGGLRGAAHLFLLLPTRPRGEAPVSRRARVDGPSPAGAVLDSRYPLPEAILADPWAAPRDVLELFGDGRLLAALQKGSLHRLPELVERAAELACSLAGCSGRSSRSLDLMLFSLHLAWQHASDETYDIQTYGDMPHVSPEEELSHLSWFLQQRFDSAESAYAFMVGRHGWGTSTSSCLTRSSFFGALRAKNFTGVLRLAWDAFAPSTPTYMTWEEFSARIGFGSVVASPGDAAGAGDWQVLSEMPRNSCFRGALEERQLLLAEDRRRLAELRQGGGAEAAEAAAVAAALAATAARGAEEPCPVASGLPADPTTSIAARLVVPLPAPATPEGEARGAVRGPRSLPRAPGGGQRSGRARRPPAGGPRPRHGAAPVRAADRRDVGPRRRCRRGPPGARRAGAKRRAPPDGRWPARGGRLAMRSSRRGGAACPPARRAGRGRQAPIGRGPPNSARRKSDLSPE
ncbi:unnamed protein product [Prorocentrum cordatum]|uniref:Uncharacterized protein n=2 Tax=Prorocentrum cordatum TaxID=2364126 RepID=A0ABN9RVN5_9DINO|nr:unnamed protein product [Polarella glacialis]